MGRFGLITSGDLLTLEKRGAAWTYLSVAPPVTIFAAQVNQVLGESDFPRGSLTVDNVTAGDITDCLPGMEVWIGTAADTDDVWRGRVRAASSGSTLYVSELGHGEPGLAVREHVRVAEDHYVTVKQYMSLWYAFPRILVSGGEGTVYVDFDQAYTDQCYYAPPIASIELTIGDLTYQHAAAFVDPSLNTVTITADASASFVVTPNAVIASHLWTLPAEAVIISGTVTDESLVFTLPPGAYWVQYQVTDSNGKTGIARRFVRVHTRTGDHAPLSILTFTGNRDRKTMRATVGLTPADADLADIPHGAFCLAWGEHDFEGEATDAISHTFAGWMTRESLGHDPHVSTEDFEIVGPGVLLDATPAVSQRLEVKVTPSTWNHIRTGLCNVPGLAWWLLKWQTNLLALFHLRMLQNYPEAWDISRQVGFGGETLGAPSLGGQLARAADLIKANFGTASDGTLCLERNPSYVSGRGAAKAEWPTRFTLTAPWWRSVEGDREHRLQVGVVQADGFAYVGDAMTPLRSQAPDYTPGQAPGTDDIQGAVIPSQLELNHLAGDHFAYANNPLPSLAIPLARTLDIFEPAAMERVGLTVSVAAFNDPVHGKAWRRLFNLHSTPVSDQTLDLSVLSVSIGQQGTIKQVTLRCEAETTGDPGRTIPIAQAGTTPEPTAADVGMTPPTPPAADFNDHSVDDEAQTDANTVYALALYNNNYYVVGCEDFISGGSSPTWAIKGGPWALGPSSVFDCWLDPGDPDDVAYLARADGTYRTGNLQNATPTWTLQNASYPAGSNPRHRMDPSNAGWIGAPHTTGAGTRNTFVWSDDQGVNWTEVLIYDYETNAEYLGMGVSEQGDGRVFQAIRMYDDVDTRVEYRIMRATNWGAAAGYWAVMAAEFEEQLTLVEVPYRRGFALNNPAAYSVAAMGTYSGTFALYKTTDAWATKVEITPEVAGVAYACAAPNVGESLAINRVDGDRILVVGTDSGGDDAILLSLNAGATWSAIYTPATEPYGAWFYPDGTQDIVVGGVNLLQHSANAGYSWTDKRGNLATLLGGTPTILKYRVVPS